MVNNRCSEVLLMTGIAGSRKTSKLPAGSAFVTCLAIQKRMSTYQGKAVLMILNFFNRNLPASYGMAAFAIRSKLATMKVCMTVCTMGTDISKNQGGVAPGAACALMHTAKWIPGLVVVELGNGADRLPTRIGMAVLARDCYGPMRICHFGLRSS